MGSAWFRPRAGGTGATPADWRGWAAIAAYALGLVVLVFTTFDGQRAVPIAVVTFIGMSTTLTAGFVVFVWVQVQRFKKELGS